MEKKDSECTCPACGTPLASEDEKCPRYNKIVESADAICAEPDADDAAGTASAEYAAATQNAAIARPHATLIMNGKSMEGTLLRGILVAKMAHIPICKLPQLLLRHDTVLGNLCCASRILQPGSISLQQFALFPHPCRP